MCDFHSICVRRDGAKCHIPANSHSGAIEFHKWRENDQMSEFRGPYFVEVEWNGDGDFPGVDRITRSSSSLNEKQRAVIADHYQALANLLKNPAQHGESMCLGAGIFAGDDYADVRWKVLHHPQCPKALVNKLAATSLYSDGKPIKSLHPLIEKIGGSLVIEAGYEITAPVLAEVTGYVDVQQGATFTAPVLAKAGSVDVRQGATFTAPVLAEVAGYVDVQQGATFTAPVLAKAGYVDVQQGATFTAPVLAKAGSVYVRQGATFTAPVLAKAGYVDVRQGATFTAPVLAKAGSVYVQQGATFTAPNLEGGKYSTPKPSAKKAAK